MTIPIVHAHVCTHKGNNVDVIICQQFDVIFNVIICQQFDVIFNVNENFSYFKYQKRW